MGVWGVQPEGAGRGEKGGKEEKLNKSGKEREKESDTQRQR